MKLLGAFLFFLTGIVVSAFSQVKSNLDLKFEPDQLLYGKRFVNPAPNLKIPETLLVDSSHVFIPKSLYTERQLNLLPKAEMRVGLPFFELPDPQNRMPIRKFDDSVNYTILKKHY